MKLMEFHNKCLTDGRLPDRGLCNCIPRGYARELYLFYPTMSDAHTLIMEGLSTMYWASLLPMETKNFLDRRKEREYTPMRQTIILFLAAMRGEL